MAHLHRHKLEIQLKGSGWSGLLDLVRKVSVTWVVLSFICLMISDVAHFSMCLFVYLLCMFYLSWVGISSIFFLSFFIYL